MSKMRNKKLNDLLKSKRSSKHEPKLGKHVSRAKGKHIQNKDDKNE
jgi:hypothetical protein